jgi:hypothetical protein
MRDGIVAAIQIPLARLRFDSNRSGIGITTSIESTHLTRWNFGLVALTLLGVLQLLSL